jgi:hypothetical protein
MKRTTRLVVLLLMLSLIAACGHMQRPKANPGNPIKRLVLLPMQNDTNDVDGPVIVRGKLVAAFQEKFYNVIPVNESDQMLRDKLGVSLGGQLKDVAPEKLGAALDAEGVLYGTLIDFGATTTGFYNVRKVRAKVKLVNTKTGAIFWENGMGVKIESKSGGLIGEGADVVADVSDDQDDVPWETIEVQNNDQAGLLGNLAIGLGQQLIENMMDTSFDRESTELAVRITRALPLGPGTSVLPQSAE